MLYCEINSEVADSISILDRGFNYGDGIFTTGKVNNGTIELLEQHLQRIQKSCDLLHMTTPDLSLLKSHLIKLAKEHKLAVIKVVVTAGSGGRGYARNANTKPNVVITLHEYPTHYALWKKEGVTLGKSSTQLGISPVAGVKHLNRLEQVLVRHELEQLPQDDLLVFNMNNQLIETSCANIFWVKDQQLYTPDLKLSGVEGLMRQHIIEHFANVRIIEGTEEAMIDADAAFICNCVMGAVPVQRYLSHSYDMQLAQSFIQQIKV